MNAPMGASESHVRVHLKEMLARRGVAGVALAEAIGIHPTNLSRLATGNVSFVRLDTLAAICRELDCQPGDLLTYEK